MEHSFTLTFKGNEHTEISQLHNNTLISTTRVERSTIAKGLKFKGWTVTKVNSVVLFRKIKTLDSFVSPHIAVRPENKEGVS